MLVLTDSNGFRINFYQLRQRILQASRDRCRTSLSDVKLRKFLRRQLTRRINRRARLIDDDILNFLRNFF